MMLSGPPARWVGRIGGVEVEMHPGARRKSRGITIAIGGVGFATGRRHRRPARRLGILPDVRKAHTAFCGARRLAWYTSRRRRTLIIADEKMQLAMTGILANVVGGHDCHLARLAKGNAGAIHAGAISAAYHAVRPGVNVGALLGQHAATLLLIEKENRATRKSFALCRLYCRCGIACTQAASISGGFDLRVFTTVEEQQ